MSNRKVYIGFSKPRSKYAIGSYLIRFFLKTPFSHTYIRFMGQDRSFIYESVGRAGTRFISSSHWLDHAIVVSEFPIDLDDTHYRKLRNYCMDNAGIKYGFFQNIGVVLAKIFKLKKNWFKKGKNCSEAVAEALINQGFTIEKTPDLITPKDIYNLLSKYNN